MGKGSTIAAALGRTTDYVKNPDKTDGGEWISAYQCDPLIADQEFQFAKSQYVAITGRSQGKNDVIAYHLRQAFKPGEIDPDTANKISYQLAMKLTKGRHAFLVCTHVDKGHIHSHIIFNSTALDCSRKFRNFWGSSFAIRKISDILCLENGLSVIEKPKSSRGSYGTWLGDGKPLTLRDNLRQIIDNSLSDGKNFDEFIVAIKAAGVEVKIGKHLAFKAPGQERFIRCKSLGDDYSEEGIRERLSGKRIVTPKHKTTAPSQAPANPSLLIDIQAKIQQGYSGAYVQWAKTFNLKEASKMLIYLQENGLDDYKLLCERTTAAKRKHNTDSARIREIELRMKDIIELQKQIGTYGKTLDIYREYRASGYSPKFYEAHTADIILHKAAKKYFDSIGMQKLPSMDKLKKEYATLAAERKKLWQGHGADKDEMVRLLMARQTVESILGITPPPVQKEHKPNRDDR